eukprot:scaffold12.g7940.t1
MAAGALRPPGAAAAAGVLSDFEKPAWCGDRDCPRFELVTEGEDYETRRYEEALWVHTRIKDLPQDEATFRARAEGYLQLPAGRVGGRRSGAPSIKPHPWYPPRPAQGYALLHEYFNKGNKDEKEIQMGVPWAYNISIHHRHGRHHRRSESAVRAWLPRWLGGAPCDELERHRERRVDMVMKAYLDGKEEPPEPTSEHVHVDRFPAWTAHVRAFDGFPTKRRFMKHFGRLLRALDDADEGYGRRWAVFSVYNFPHELENRHNEVLLPADEGEGERGGGGWWERVRALRGP